jgi:hypothetical protein
MIMSTKVLIVTVTQSGVHSVVTEYPSKVAANQAVREINESQWMLPSIRTEAMVISGESTATTKTKKKSSEVDIFNKD